MYLPLLLTAMMLNATRKHRNGNTQSNSGTISPPLPRRGQPSRRSCSTVLRTTTEIASRSTTSASKCGPAEIFGLLGPNGSGKTTLFRILSTLMTPTGGRASIQGFDVAREPNKVRQQIGIVFQARSVDIKLTVAENLKHQGNLYGLSGARLKSRIDDVLGRVGLLDRKGDSSRHSPEACSAASSSQKA